MFTEKYNDECRIEATFQSYSQQLQHEAKTLGPGDSNAGPYFAYVAYVAYVAVKWSSSNPYPPTPSHPTLAQSVTM